MENLRAARPAAVSRLGGVSADSALRDVVRSDHTSQRLNARYRRVLAIRSGEIKTRDTSEEPEDVHVNTFEL